jgi:2-polyprenyl-3-methyl-5-hydroxy-6-metoxy-1,4-benzoquinol methylase
MKFEKRLLAAYNGAAATLMIGIGHQTGLFRAMAGLAPSTSEEVAAASGLNERYVREWLGAMVTSRVVECDANRYWLPEEHAALLTGPQSMAGPSQYIAELGRVETKIIDCFRNGGGIGYEHFPRFHEIMAESSAQFVAGALEAHVLPLVPGLVERLRAGIRVIDVGCGRGMTLHRLAELFPQSRFEGVDFSADVVAWAEQVASHKGLRNVTFRSVDAASPLYPESYDVALTFDAVHDQAHPLDVLRNIANALKRDGFYLMQEIKGTSHHHSDVGHPLGTLLYTISCMHCMTVSLAQGGAGLGAMWGEEKTRDYLTRAGFAHIDRHELPHDIQNYWYVARKRL